MCLTPRASRGDIRGNEIKVTEKLVQRACLESSYSVRVSFLLGFLEKYIAVPSSTESTRGLRHTNIFVICPNRKVG